MPPKRHAVLSASSADRWLHCPPSARLCESYADKGSDSIDIETYSSAPLAKCGVYKYVEVPDFEILLLGYSADGGAVQVVDLACGETLPDEVKAALTDEAGQLNLPVF